MHSSGLGLKKAALENLHTWYQAQKRTLPWRSKPTLYRVWISEIMLQQTQVTTVLPYFEKFIKRFPSVKKLAESSLDDVYACWAGLGYYSRARNIHKAAKLILQKRSFPKTREEWLEIPGVGPYTAGAILSIALNQPVPILDGNVERVLGRVHCTSNKNDLWEFSAIAVAKAFNAKIPPSDLNQALMELGALVCLKGVPKCHLCPFRRCCQASHENRISEFPVRKIRSWKKVKETVVCVLSQKKVLLKQKLAGEWHAGLWDLPQEKEFHLKKGKQPNGFTIQYVVTNHRVNRFAMILSKQKMEKKKGLGKIFKWVSLESPEVAIGSACKKTLVRLRSDYASPQSSGKGLRQAGKRKKVASRA